MPLGLLLMLVFGFWFQVEITSQIVYGDLDRVFRIEENIRRLHDAEYEARWPRSAATTRNKRHTDAERGCVQWNSGTIWCCRARRHFPATAR